MPPRQPGPHQIGATQAPEFVSEELESVQLAGLDARFELEDVRVCSASLLEVDAGSGHVERVSFEDCVFTGADFQGASIKATVFSRCQLVQRRGLALD